MQNPYLSLLSTAWKYARHEKRRFILIYSMFVVANLIVAMNPLFYGWFVNQLQQHGAAVINTSWIYVAGFLGLRLFEWAFHGPARVMERKLAFRVSQNFMEELYHKVLHLPVDWHQDNHSGSTINKLRKAYEALRDFFQSGFVYLYSFGKFVFSFAAMIYFSPIFGAVGVVLGLITIMIIVQFDKPFIKSLREVNQKEHEVSSTLFDSLSNIRTVITLKLESRIQTRLMDKIKNVFPAFKRNVTINEWKWFVAQMMVGLIYCVSVFGYIYQNYVPGEVFQIGGLIVLIGYVNQFTSVFNDIASQYTQIVKFHTEVQNVKEVEKAYDNLSSKEGISTLPANWNTINIDGLNFVRREKDPSRKPSGLFDLNMRIQKGQRIALIGESGSGKSTLLSLLRGLHTPQTTSYVMVNGKTVANFESIASTVTLFPQEPEIFENSILYNITLGLPFTEEEVMQVCEEAHFADVVKKLPAGLHTHIQEKGVNLSGGQKQRLALARGILAARQSDIILMDEPTSSVDPRTEKMIYKNMFNTFQGKSVISSLHRLHLLTQFDYIYILRNGTVIDEGSFEELKRYSLVFKEMWEHQATTDTNNNNPEPNFPHMNVAL
ncbi:ABC transporter ATP-binding protein [Chryseosolibacter indicus]|uniref:ABC transporter ATP-binding protein/permease n=1 Tax=Chryseosolibacter indicus TaxID=2782351 RepID=A0ABS5VR48_9BACT|nr:ABC transporter ATP-binding protein [Chryseosolibacter indicus]MBT1703821.1 ABC transporter ATP-binding protein/permease [Chryseosolibacter indicus]